MNLYDVVMSLSAIIFLMNDMPPLACFRFFSILPVRYSQRSGLTMNVFSRKKIFLKESVLKAGVTVAAIGVLMISGTVTTAFAALDNCLYTPTGARSRSMGGSGIAIANDGTAPYYNPALLGLDNFRWNGGMAYYDNEMCKYIYHHYYYSLVAQDDRFRNRGAAVFVNRYEDWPWYHEHESDGSIDTVTFANTSYAMSAGYCLWKSRWIKQSAGLSVKYLRTDSRSTSMGTFFSAYGLSFDAGYVAALHDRVRISMVLKNVGTGIRSSSPDWTEPAKMPLIFGVGIGYQDDFTVKNIALAEIAAECSFSALRTRDYGTLQSIATGVELLLGNTVTFRTGYILGDVLEYWMRDKVSTGIGITLFNHFRFDYYETPAVQEQYDVHKEKVFSISCERVLRWKKSDLLWWLADNNGGER